MALEVLVFARVESQSRLAGSEGGAGGVGSAGGGDVSGERDEGDVGGISLGKPDVPSSSLVGVRGVVEFTVDDGGNHWQALDW